MQESYLTLLFNPSFSSYDYNRLHALAESYECSSALGTNCFHANNKHRNVTKKHENFILR